MVRVKLNKDVYDEVYLGIEKQSECIFYVCGISKIIICRQVVEVEYMF